MINKVLPLEIYVHIPFCVRKCLYCDFLSGPANEETIDNYVRILLKEIEYYGMQERFRKYFVHTIFFGGGTPSILSGKAIDAILRKIGECFSFGKDVEITIEMNPGAAADEKLIQYYQSGINRISIGLQSTNDEELKALGRIHTYEDFLNTYHQVRNVGFENVNVDLMSAIPNQTIESYQKTLKKIMELKPEHISAYSLIIEDGTPFASMKLNLPDEDTERKMYTLTKRLLLENGYQRYEISNYAKPGYECRHNSGYWERIPYLGIGLGASSFFDEIRWKNGTAMSEYLSNFDKHYEVEKLSINNQMEEFMFLGLRMTKGVSNQQFSKLFHKQIVQIYPVIYELMEEGLILSTSEGFQLSDYGIDISNYVLANFLLDE